MTMKQFAELQRWLQEYGFDPYNSDLADTRLAVTQALGLPL